MTTPRRRWLYLLVIAVSLAIIARQATVYPRLAELAISVGAGVAIIGGMHLALFLPWIFRRRH